MKIESARNCTYFTYESELGRFTVVSDGSAILSVKVGDIADPPGAVYKADALTDWAARQLDEYFKRERREFDIPLNPKGTNFQLSVWDALKKIPYGETRSYKQIAQTINNPNACRAVGMANNKNPIWIIIPCHRVIGASGELTGYGGGLDMKQRLLDIESNHPALRATLR